MTLDEAGGLGRQTRLVPGALHTELLANRVGGGDALPLTVARPRHPEQHAIDAIAVADGVLQPLEEEGGRALAHHETVGTLGVWASARGREGADLAELHVGGRTHVPVDAAGDHGVVLTLDESADSRVHGRHGRRAGGVHDVVGTAEVEEIGDSPGYAVGELARHGVLGDLRVSLPYEVAELSRDRLLDIDGKRAEAGRVPKFAHQLREVDPHRCLVVPLACHGIAEDDCHPFVVQRAPRVAVVDERLVCAGHGPFLSVVHGVGHSRHEGELPGMRVPVPVPDPTTDLGVRLVRCFRVGVVVQLGIPSRWVDVADAVAALLDVLPKLGSIGRVRHDGADPDDCDGAAQVIAHLVSVQLVVVRSGWRW